MLGDEFPEQLHRIVPIADGTARIADGIAVPLRPMIGVIGVAPAGAARADRVAGRRMAATWTRV